MKRSLSVPTSNEDKFRVAKHFSEHKETERKETSLVFDNLFGQNNPNIPMDILNVLLLDNIPVCYYQVLSFVSKLWYNTVEFYKTKYLRELYEDDTEIRKVTIDRADGQFFMQVMYKKENGGRLPFKIDTFNRQHSIESLFVDVAQSGNENMAMWIHQNLAKITLESNSSTRNISRIFLNRLVSHNHFTFVEKLTESKIVDTDSYYTVNLIPHLVSSGNKKMCKIYAKKIEQNTEHNEIVNFDNYKTKERHFAHIVGVFILDSIRTAQKDIFEHFFGLFSGEIFCDDVFVQKRIGNGLWFVQLRIYIDTLVRTDNMAFLNHIDSKMQKYKDEPFKWNITDGHYLETSYRCGSLKVFGFLFSLTQNRKTMSLVMQHCWSMILTHVGLFEFSANRCEIYIQLSSYLVEQTSKEVYFSKIMDASNFYDTASVMTIEVIKFWFNLDKDKTRTFLKVDDVLRSLSMICQKPKLIYKCEDIKWLLENGFKQTELSWILLRNDPSHHTTESEERGELTEEFKKKVGLFIEYACPLSLREYTYIFDDTRFHSQYIVTQLSQNKSKYSHLFV